jgi:peptide/nickel transport system permease protein
MRLPRRRPSLPPLATYIGKRLLFIPVAIVLVVTLSFGIVNLLPSDPARQIAGDFASEESLAQIRAELRLDESIPKRYLTYVGISHVIDDREPRGLLQGDLGTSYFTKRPVTEEIRQYLPSTLELVVMSITVAIMIGGVMGLAASYYGGLADHFMRLGMTVVQSIPDFLLGLVLIYVFFFRLRWVPAPVGQFDVLDEAPPRVTGAVIPDAAIAGEWQTLRSAFLHALLPVLTLGIFYSAYFAKTTRSVLDVAFASNQVEFARACGLPERKVVGYALRQARTPILTYGGILFAALLGGAALVETIFSWNGLGQWAITSVLKVDVPAIQGFTLIAGLFTLAIFLLLDVLVVILDPRVSYE